MGNERTHSARWQDDQIRVAPYVPTPPEIVTVMLEMAEASERDILYDLGCGDGRILFAAVTSFGVRKAVGFELDPELCRGIREQALKLKVHERVLVVNRDLFEADLSDASIITLYLTTAGNERLRSKLEAETKPGTRIVSHDFTIDNWNPQRVVERNSQALNPHHIYLYSSPQSFPKRQSSKFAGLLRLGRRLIRHNSTE